MPIDNNEDFVAIDDFTHGIGFNPFEEPVTFSTQRPFESNLTTATQTPYDWTIAPPALTVEQAEAEQLQTIRRFEQMMRGRVRSNDEDKPKKKSMSKVLDEVSEANKDVFDRLNKIQDEINTIEKVKLVELANKHDDLIFIAIGKNYTLKKASEKTKQQYINTLSQQLVSIVNNVTQGKDHTLEDFTRKMIRSTSRYVMFDEELENIYTKVFADVYEYYNLINEKKKEKKSLMGREDKKPTVCEDYLYGSNRDNNIRIVLNQY